MNFFKALMKFLKKKDWLILELLIIFIPILLLMSIAPIGDFFEFSTDEGTNVIKADLVNRGYVLYSDIWSDQPPVLTYILSWLFKVFGNSILAGRLFILFCTYLLMLAGYFILKELWGRAAAIINVVLIFFLPEFFRISIGILIGLPSLCFALTGMYLILLWHKKRNILFLLFSAILCVLSLFTKLITAYLLVIFFIGIFIDSWKKNTTISRKLFAPALWGFLVAFCAMLIVFFIIKIENLNQLLEVHLKAAARENFNSNEFTLNYYIKDFISIIILGFLSLPFIIKKRNYLSLYIVAWALVSYGLLFKYKPVWFHQIIMLTLPLSLLSSIAVTEFIRYLNNKRKEKRLTIFTAIAGLVFMFSCGYLVYEQLISRFLFIADNYSAVEEESYEDEILKLVIKYAPYTRLFVTDTPMFAFRANLEIPPGLGVFSEKRFVAGKLTEDDIIKTVKDKKPEMIFWGRFTFPNLEKYVSPGYTRVFDKANRFLYIRNDIINTVAQLLNRHNIK